MLDSADRLLPGQSFDTMMSATAAPWPLEIFSAAATARTGACECTVYVIMRRRRHEPETEVPRDLHENGLSRNLRVINLFFNNHRLACNLKFRKFNASDD